MNPLPGVFRNIIIKISLNHFRCNFINRQKGIGSFTHLDYHHHRDILIPPVTNTN